MTVLQGIIENLNNRFPVGTNEYADLVKILLTKNLPAEEQQIRDAWAISANREYLNLDLETYINTI